MILDSSRKSARSTLIWPKNTDSLKSCRLTDNWFVILKILIISFTVIMELHSTKYQNVQFGTFRTILLTKLERNLTLLSNCWFWHFVIFRSLTVSTSNTCVVLLNRPAVCASPFASHSRLKSRGASQCLLYCRRPSPSLLLWSLKPPELNFFLASRDREKQSLLCVFAPRSFSWGPPKRNFVTLIQKTNNTFIQLSTFCCERERQDVDLLIFNNDFQFSKFSIHVRRW